jgi:Membrane protein involved in the export of O-antigen and teichoic acid
MGIVIRQSIKATFVSYIAVIVGAINQLFVSTEFLTAEQMAVSRILLENSLIFSAFAHLGTPFIIDKFFSRYKNEEENHHGFLGFILIYPLFGFAIFALIYLLFQNSIMDYFNTKSPYLNVYYFITLPLTFFWIYFTLLETYCKNYQRITVPTIIRELFLKVGNIVLIIIFAFGWINFDWVIYGLVVLYALAVLIILIYVIQLKRFYFSINTTLFTGKAFKELFLYGFIIMLGGIGYNLLLFVDRILLAGNVGLESTAIFILAVYIAGIIEIPRRALTQMSIPFISKALKDDDIPLIHNLYHKTIINQLIASCLLFICIWCNIDDLFQLMPKKEIYENGKYVILIIGFIKLIDMAAGMGGEIILYSKYFRYATYLVIVMVVISVILNLIFIPLFKDQGYIGAAVALMLTTVIYILCRSIIIFNKFRIHPFKLSTLKILCLTFIFIVVFSLTKINFQTPLSIIAGIGIKSLLIITIYTYIIYKLNFSYEFNSIINKGIELVNKKIRK